MRSMGWTVVALCTAPLLLLFHVPASWAVVPRLAGDTYVSSANPTSNYGAATTLYVKPGFTSFFKFDLSTLPAGTVSADVLSATVTVFVGTVTTAGTVNWAPVTGSWDEKTITFGTAPALGSLTPIAVPGASQFVSFDVTNTVKGWVATPSSNNGIALAPVGTVSVQFNSKEGTGTAHTATLDITLSAIHETGLTTFIGAAAGVSNTTAVRNTALGGDALYSNTSGDDNTAVGVTALAYNTTGSINTAVGDSTLYSNTTGARNTALGGDALYSNTIGNHNTAVGVSALFFTASGSANTALGDSALYRNTIGDYNIAVGVVALASNTTGRRNTALGSDALYSNTIGNDNIAIGNSAGFSVNGDENIDIGNTGVPGDAYTIRLGDVQTRTFIAGIFGATAAGGVPVYVDSDGHLGTTTSSARFKDDIRDMDDASSGLMKLRPVQFRYKKEIDPTGLEQYGLVAEEVAKVYPDLVVYDDKGRPQAVRYHFVNAMLLNEVQKQARRIAEQTEQIRSQAREITELAQEVRQLKVQAVHIDALTARLAEVEAVLAADRADGPRKVRYNTRQGL